MLGPLAQGGCVRALPLLLIFLLFAATPAAASVDSAPDRARNQTETVPAAIPRGTREVVLIDTGIKDWRSLAVGVPEGAAIVRVSPDEDGLAVLARALEGHSGIRALHVISHGEPGAIRVGNVRVDREALGRRDKALRKIRSALEPGADILLAACDTASGSSGRPFLDSLAQATGTDVAASTDTTGSGAVGANWDLEAQVGDIEARLALSGEAMEKFRGRLAIDSQVTFGFSKYDGSLGNGATFTQPLEADGSTDQMSFSDWRIDEFDDPDFGVNMNNGGPDSAFSDPAGDNFQFASFTTEVFCGTSWSFDVVGYKDGSPVAGATKSYSLGGVGGPTTRSVGFESVDEVRFENYSTDNGAQCLVIDDIVVDQEVVANTTPSFSNLDATVMYDEEAGSPVVIDGDAEISDAELDGANDYAGSSLTIERSGGASGEDDFDFDTGVGTFSVSGSDLLTGGNVFASFTESGGTLTINFNSSQAAATSTLVDDVLQGITYANPSDPDVVEYALTLTFDDGGGLSTGESLSVLVDPELAPIDSATTLDFTAQESELAHGDPVDARIIQELLFYGFEFEHVSDSLIDSSDLHVHNATADASTTPNRIESDTPFRLDSIDIENFSTHAQDVTVHGYLNGSPQASETFSFAAEEGPSMFDMDALNAAFQSLDELRFTTSVNHSVAIDNIVVDAGNQSPTLDLNTGEGGNDHTAAFSENDHQGDTLPLGGGIAVTGPVLVEDSDGDPETITVTLDNNQGDTGEQLYLDNGGLVGAVTGSGSGNSLTLARNGAAPAELADTLTNVRYQNDDDTPTETDRTITIVATDDLGATTSATSTVTVEAGNDAPSITGPGGTLQPDEDIAFGLSGANELQIADVDAGGATVEVSLSADNGTLTLGSSTGLTFDSGGNGTGAFTVSGTVADLNNALATLDYQGNTNYFGMDTVTATVNDRGNTGADPGNTGDASSEADTTTVSLDVQAVEDAPTITAIADQSTDEDTPLSGIAFTVDDAESAASGLTLSFSAADPSLIAGHAFGGSGANRTLEIVPADDQNGSTVITVTVDDGSLATQEDFQLTINPVNDPPTVSPAISTFDTTVNEDEAVPSAMFTVDDIESGGASVTVTASSDNQTLVSDGNLTVTDNGGGDRTLGVTLANDENGTANITVTLDDGTDTVDDSFTLTVNPQNDPPAVSLTPTSDTIQEGNGSPVTVAQINIDDDMEDGSTNDLSLTGPDAGDFAINGGALDFTASADFEAKDTYDVSVEVDDPGVGTTPDDTAGFTLNIADVDEAPTFSATGPFGVSEADGNGTAVGDVDAVDGDGGSTDANLTYAIVGGNTGGAFAIDGGTGAITVADATAVDYDTSSTFNLDVEADDGTNAPTATVTINVNNAVPSTPVDTDGAKGGTVAEDAANGTAVGITTDASDPGGGNVSYSLTDDAGGRFQINAGTGVVTVADASLIDYESASSHTISVQASDDDGADSATASFTVGVTDVDSSPTFSATGPFSVSESAGDGSAVGDVDAVDGDGGAVDAGLTYAITGGNGGGAFAIDNSGALQVADASLIDFESAAAFTLTVEANDGNSTTPASVTVNVTDEPPGQPADTDGAADTVAEDAANGTTVGIDVEAVDPAGGAVSYVLVNDAGGRFAIDGNGVVTVADSAGLDFESVTSHTIEIEARDPDGSASATLSAVIAITDAPDKPTVTAPPDLTGSSAVDASGLYTEVDLERDGDATANDDEDGTLTPEPESVDNPAWLRPGTNTITWSVTDSSGASATEDQIVEVRPRAALGVDRTVQEGTTVELPVELNGNMIDGTSPMIDFDVADSSTATGADYAGFVAPGSITLMSRTATLDFDVLADGTAGEPPETLVIETTGASEAALAERTQTTVTLTEENQPPVVTLSAAQSGGADPAVVIDKSAGNVTVTASTSDATATSSMTFNWIADGLTDTDGSANDETFVFSPTGLSAGLYTLSVEAGDNGSPAETGQARIALRVLDSLPALGSSDTDKDGLNDNDPDEGRADRDGDLIPDYRDPYRDANTVHQALSDNAGYRLETEPGLNLALGAVAFAVDAEGVRVTADEIATVTGWRDDRTNVGGRFDFTLYGLPHPGASAHVVIPQRAPIPEQAVYRLAGVVGNWQTFASNPDNALASAPGAPGYCPPPDAPAFTTGLTPGDHCVRLTFKDGGMNDADGQANGRVRSTGGVARQRQTPDRVEVESSGGGWSPAWFWMLGVFMTLRWVRSRETG